jgi:hypothetical protein
MYVDGNPARYADPFGLELINPSFSPGTKFWYNNPWPKTIPLNWETAQRFACVLDCLGKKKSTDCMITGGRRRRATKAQRTGRLGQWTLQGQR